MKKKESIIKGIFNYSISTWANLIIGFLSVVIMTRVVKPDVYGLISIFFSASSVLMYVLSIGMDSAYIRFYNEPPFGNTQNQLLYKNLVWTTVIYLVVGVAVIPLFGDITSDLIFGIASRTISGLLLLYTFCTIILRYLNISFRMSFQVRKYNTQNILMNCLSRFLIIVAALYTSDFHFITFILSIGLGIVLIYYGYIQRPEYIPFNASRELDTSLSLKGYGEYFRFAFFSAPTYIVTYLNTYLSQQIIRSGLSAFALGIFSSTGMYVHILGALKGGFGTYWAAYVYKNYKTDKERIERMHDYVMLFAILMLSLVVMFRDVIYLFIGKDYHDSKQFFSLLLLFPIFSFILETTEKGIALAKKNHITLATHAVSVLVNVILCILFIPVLGLKGAALANAISGIVLFVANTYWGQKYYHTIRSYWRSTLGAILILMIAIIPALFMNIYIICIINIFVVMVAIVLYKNQVFYIYQTVKSRLRK